MKGSRLVSRLTFFPCFTHCTELTIVGYSKGLFFVKHKVIHGSKRISSMYLPASDASAQSFSRGEIGAPMIGLVDGADDVAEVAVVGQTRVEQARAAALPETDGDHVRGAPFPRGKRGRRLKELNDLHFSIGKKGGRRAKLELLTVSEALRRPTSSAARPSALPAPPPPRRPPPGRTLSGPARRQSGAITQPGQKGFE